MSVASFYILPLCRQYSYFWSIFCLLCKR